MNYPLKKILLSAVALAAAWGIGAVPRPEYPRPQMEREQWENLNGTWSYTFDLGRSGMDRKLFESDGFDGEIVVPFCPECQLSGVGYTDFIPAMWYQRTIAMPKDWEGKRTLLHFGGVDYFSAVYIDGKLVGRHCGGSSPFTYDITDFIADGNPHNLVVRVEDDVRSNTQAAGKQSRLYYSKGAMYTRTTGIWQTVWMEPIDAAGLKDAYVIPDIDRSCFVIRPETYSSLKGAEIEVIVSADGKKVARDPRLITPGMSIEIPVKNAKLWSPENPFLYDINYTIYDADGNVIDKVKSYNGMRKIEVIGNKVYLNNKPYFLRLVLDQGFYPEGLWTAPSLWLPPEPSPWPPSSP